MNPQAEAPLAGADPSPALSATTPDRSASLFRRAFRPARRLSRGRAIAGALVAILVVAGLAGLAWYLTRPVLPGGPGNTTASGPPGSGPGAGAARRPAGSTVGVATAERASIPVLLDALGTVTPQATVRVRPQVSGVLEKVLFSEGQMVRKGDLLATIDPRQFEMALMQATGQRQRDEAQLDSARVTLQRFKTLLEQDSIARQEVDTQAALVKQLEGTLAIDRANEGTARLNLGYTRVVAPISGRVGLRTVDVGNVVSNSDANGVALITQLAPIDVVFSVPQDQVSELQQLTTAGAAGPAMKALPMKVTALDRTRSNTLDTGVFASLDNQIDVTTGTVRAKARFDNRNLTLFPSQFVNVQVLVKTLEDAIVVPVTAVRKGSDGDYVYVLKEDRTVAMRPVKRGMATVDKIVIASGLQAGERVITEGADRLKDGSPVVLAGEQPRAPGAGPAAGQRRPRGDEAGGRNPGPPAGAAGGNASPVSGGNAGAGPASARPARPAAAERS